MKTSKLLGHFMVAFLPIIVLLTVGIFLSFARAEGADLIVRSTADLVQTPPATDASPNTILAQNPVVLLILALAVGGGIPATLWLTQYTREFAADAEYKLSRLGLRLIGLVSGIVVSALLLLLGMYNIPELRQFPDALKVLGIGLAFGVFAGGWHDSKRYSGNITNVYAGGAGFGDGDVPDAPKAGSIKDYS